MKKDNVRMIVTLTLFVAVVASSVIAQGRPQFRADIPVNFHVAGQTKPSGKYTLDRPTSTNGMVLVRSLNGGKAVYAISNGKQAKSTPENTKLVFRRYGDQYFLAQIWAKGDQAGILFPVTKEEKKVINSRPDRHLAKATEAEEITVLLD